MSLIELCCCLLACMSQASLHPQAKAQFWEKQVVGAWTSRRLVQNFKLLIARRDAAIAEMCADDECSCSSHLGHCTQDSWASTCQRPEGQDLLDREISHRAVASDKRHWRRQKLRLRAALCASGGPPSPPPLPYYWAVQGNIQVFSTARGQASGTSSATEPFHATRAGALSWRDFHMSR